MTMITTPEGPAERAPVDAVSTPTEQGAERAPVQALALAKVALAHPSAVLWEGPDWWELRCEGKGCEWKVELPRWEYFDAEGAHTRHVAIELHTAAIGAGYVIPDHIEYSASHRFGPRDVTDDDGKPFDDWATFMDEYVDYGNVHLQHRYVTKWETFEARGNFPERAH